MIDLFPDITIDDELSCVEREIKMRESVYPRWVAAKKMSQETADRELRTMRPVHASMLEYRRWCREREENGRRQG